MPVVSVVTGKEVQRNRSLRVQVFHTTQHTDTEPPLFVRAKDKDTSVIPLGNPQFMLARSSIDKEIGGQWVEQGFTVEEQSMLKLSVSKSGRLERVTSQTFLYVREAAAVREITIPAGLGSDSVLENVIITGRFDILDFDEGMLRGGKTSKTHERWKSQFHEVMRNKVLSVKEVESEEKPLPPLRAITVEREDGEKVFVPRRKRVRNLGI